jgi:hypothetical protein
MADPSSARQKSLRKLTDSLRRYDRAVRAQKPTNQNHLLRRAFARRGGVRVAALSTPTHSRARPLRDGANNPNVMPSVGAAGADSRTELSAAEMTNGPPRTSVGRPCHYGDGNTRAERISCMGAGRRAQGRAMLAFSQAANGSRAPRPGVAGRQLKWNAAHGPVDVSWAMVTDAA